MVLDPADVHRHAVAGELPPLDGRTEVQLRSGAPGAGELSPHRHLRTHEASPRLEHRHLVGLEPERREPLRHGPLVEHLVGQVPRPHARQRAGHDVGVGSPDHQRARPRDHRLAGVGRQSFPALVRPAHERHVGRVLEVGLAHDARVAVARAAVVGRRELLEPRHQRPPLGEGGGGRRAHPAEADHDHPLHRRHSRRPGRRDSGARNRASTHDFACGNREFGRMPRCHEPRVGRPHAPSRRRRSNPSRTPRGASGSAGRTRSAPPTTDRAPTSRCSRAWPRPSSCACCSPPRARRPAAPPPCGARSASP